MIDTINKLRTAERALLAGCTYDELAEAMGDSIKTARRTVILFRDSGAIIDESAINDKGKLLLKMKFKTRLFRNA